MRPDPAQRRPAPPFLRAAAAAFLCAAAAAATGPSPCTAQERPSSDPDPPVGTRFRDCAACPEMVVIAAGSFRMGSPPLEAERWEWEGPQRDVTIGEAFALGVREVTFDEWEACVRGGGCGGRVPDDEGWGRGSRPVMNVSWNDAQAYARWLREETGEAYRLPTEAEWEYAARAGTSAARPWGESAADQCRYANGGGGMAPCADGHFNTAPAGSYAPNAWGLHDMMGNVWELVEDCWHQSYEGAPTDGSAWMEPGCAHRVYRGGGWDTKPKFIRSAYRFHDVGWGRTQYVGFRVARGVG